jgi:hypothetical protein
MSSNYALYIKEREGFDIIESDEGFATYKIMDKECYIRDIYIKPEFRDKGLTIQMLSKISKIAKEQNCDHLSGSVDTNCKFSTENTKSMILAGFKILKNTFSMIMFIKEL